MWYNKNGDEKWKNVSGSTETVQRNSRKNRPLSVPKIKETVGKGYEMPHNIHFPPGFKLAREFS